jgi:hypothetical protein
LPCEHEKLREMGQHFNLRTMLRIKKCENCDLVIRVYLSTL